MGSCARRIDNTWKITRILLVWVLAGWLGGVACVSGSGRPLFPLGAECQGSGALCGSGLCHWVSALVSVCSQPCADGGGCPAEFACVSDTSVPVPLCLPVGVGGICQSDATCPLGHRCDPDSRRCYIPVVRQACEPCDSARQCPTGGTCLESPAAGERYCTEACDPQAGCRAGFRCDNALTTPQCVPDNPLRACRIGRGLCAPCQADTDCGGGADMCVRNLASGEQFCGVDCDDTSACAEGFSCMDLSGVGLGPRQCVPDNGTCRGYCDAADPQATRRQCGLGAACDPTTQRCTPVAGGGLCSPCQEDEDCQQGVGGTESSRCVVNQCPDCLDRGSRFCAPGCGGADGRAQPSLCGEGLRCVGLRSATEGPFVCVPESGSCRGGVGVPGDDCTSSGAGGCVSGICLDLGESRVCSAPCRADPDCGDGRLHCCAVDNGRFDCSRDPSAGGAGVCVPRGGALGADCAPGRPPCLDGGVCVDLGSAQVCTVECASGTPCPESMRCAPGERVGRDGTRVSTQVCVPDSGGEVGAECTYGPSSCRTGLCLKQAATGTCTRACTEADCPQGYDCDEVELVGGTTRQVCVPAAE